MTRLLLLCPLVSLLACADKATDDGSLDSGTDTDSGVESDSGGDTDSGADTDTSDCTPAAETCNGVDDDCDGDVDEADATDATAYYADVDDDGFGDPSAMVTACAAPEDYVTDNTDCNDLSALAHPGREEVPGDGLDNDCDPNTTVTTSIFEAFSTSSAENGNWTLGYARDADPARFAPMTTYLTTGFTGVDAWRYPTVDSLTVYRNNTSSTIRYVQAWFPAYSLILHPGTGHAAAMRWTAPAATECAVDLIFTGCDTTTTIVTAYAGGSLFVEDTISSYGDEAYGYAALTLEAGETIDLLVDADGDKNWDSTCIDAFLTCR